jgi:triphosphoribosyl-dephospho-CoA synthase
MHYRSAMEPLEPDVIAWAAQLACVLEVSAHKPGNVTLTTGFSDITALDLIASALAIGPAMRDSPRSGVGRTIRRAVDDTHRFVAANANLGIVLLLAPLAKAAGTAHPGRLRSAVGDVLANLTGEDRRQAFAAIRKASPGGLGRSDTMDVNDPDAGGTLLEAMVEARGRDAIAREYATRFQITFATGYPCLDHLWRAGHTLSDAIVQTALTILARVPDTLIMRKEGWETAEEVSAQARDVLDRGGVLSEGGRRALVRLDGTLRDDGHRLNPGTTADLVTASIFVFLVEQGLASIPDLVRRW